MKENPNPRHDSLTKISAISADKLRRKFDPKNLSFSSTEDLPALDEVIGQGRAEGAIAFGIDIQSSGYNIYALGPVGTGKTTTIKKYLERKAADQPVPDDWLYVNNFDDSDKPRALRLPAGIGCQFEKDMERLVENLETDVPNAFEGEEYQKEQERIQEKLQGRRQQVFENLEGKAQEKDFTLLQTPAGIVLAPLVEGEVLPPEEYDKLDEATRQQLERNEEELQDEFRDTMREVRRVQQRVKDRIRDLDRQVVNFAVRHLLQELREKYSEHSQIMQYLDEVRGDILENVEEFKSQKQMKQVQQQLPIPIGQTGQGVSFDKYRVNLIVDNCDTKGAPVILESNPTYQNLIGRVEHQAQFGALVTNFMMIKGGALHQANGGYLMVEARDVLLKPLAWQALKRALKDGCIKIESMSEYYGAISTRTLEPEPIPLDVKVVVVGNPLLYYLLYQLDEDFHELFKVKADFALQTDWTDETVNKYAQFIGTICREEGLKHFDASGVAKIIEHSARMVANQKKLATKFGEIVDLIRESSYWANRNGNGLVQGADVQKAIEEKVFRSNRLEERIQEMIQDETILIDTEGEVVGQINGISVISLGDYSFGKPSRITTRTHVGNSGVVNIERETQLGGRLHNKGVMILTGYLGGKYAGEVPMALSAHITFEQSYEEIEGDSASSAELYALLSSLAEFPLRQDLAVTGSVNQRGQVQAIGGVNEKIEGFFDVCRIIGLTGHQGVIIPKSNAKNLMLREDVVEAVESGKFHIFPVSTVDEGIALLTGKEAGERKPDGTYPEGTVNWGVQTRLNELAEKVKAFTMREKTSEDGRGQREKAQLKD